LDDSKVSEDPRFKGLEIELHHYSGARVLRVVHPGAQAIDEHCHDWSYIGLYTAGRYIEQFDGGEADMRGPSAVFHPAGRPHADRVCDIGLETLTIEFEPGWLRHHGFTAKLDRSRGWAGGMAGRASLGLASLLLSPAASEAAVARATARFLEQALGEEPAESPRWIDDARRLVCDHRHSTADLARRFDLHPAYIAHAYRRAAGEGISATLRRRRVEAASALLRRTGLPLAEIAIDAGFCDQSHMNRCFAAVLGRTPARVREEGALFAEQLGLKRSEPAIISPAASRHKRIAIPFDLAETEAKLGKTKRERS
jgi:AraC family transcriptional regulator